MIVHLLYSILIVCINMSWSWYAELSDRCIKNHDGCKAIYSSGSLFALNLIELNVSQDFWVEEHHDHQPHFPSLYFKTS
ncbi:hypothetical protein QL093DRAFT_2256192 [Fusarium oxysporum]|nr:hypothetical protein QL093DRAFT_2508272 [Fusarium oxysporum]KAJ9413412.1 hypothetical protein QL093DRAFT_2473444 [Fusarium oxysporum]KAJ9413914.1 hypothetical protein QL093DRAFT_2506930 [Fusarium oxysporum]KAJ9413920.1 hypothetical protein QL093DRAFT_2507053 [Fusarium oxysporum]KAJ9415750.1 hypothetical protein QL093DRAFT_2423595 [Fusarium oxysporum]